MEESFWKDRASSLQPCSPLRRPQLPSLHLAHSRGTKFRDASSCKVIAPGLGPSEGTAGRGRLDGDGEALVVVRLFGSTFLGGSCTNHTSRCNISDSMDVLVEAAGRMAGVACRAHGARAGTSSTDEATLLGWRGAGDGGARERGVLVIGAGDGGMG